MHMGFSKRVQINSSAPLRHSPGSSRMVEVNMRNEDVVYVF